MGSQRPDSKREGPHLELSWSENKQGAIWGWARVARRRRWWRRRWRGAPGTTSATSSSPAWATRSGSATCGGSPTSAPSTEVKDSIILLRRLRLESVLRLGTVSVTGRRKPWVRNATPTQSLRRGSREEK